MNEKSGYDKKTEFLSIRVTKATKAELEKISTDHERSTSWVVGKIIDSFLENKNSVKF